MGFLDGLKALLGGGPQCDPGLGDETARGFVANVKGANYSVINTLLPQLRGAGVWNDRAFYLSLIGQHSTPFMMALDAWCDNEPNGVTPHLIRGVARIEWAWQVRGSGMAPTVSQAGWKGFADRLLMAESDLGRVMQLDPEDPTPYAFMLRVSRGQSKGLDHARALLEEVAQREPGHWLALQSYLVTLAPKWSGLNVGEMLAAARTAATRPGLALLPAVAHVEGWNHVLNETDQHGAAAYARDPAVIGEIDRAVMAAAVDLAAPQPWHALAWNVPAFAYHLAGDAGRLGPLMQRLGWARAEYPWYYSGEPDSAFAAARKLAGLK